MTSQPTTPTLQELEELTRQAGEILRNAYEARPGSHNDLVIDHKGPIDLVTQVDRQSEEFLISAIRKQFPDHHIVAEESGGRSGETQCTWYIDPIDGTVNFAHGIPFFAVSVAYEEAGELRLGAITIPCVTNASLPKEALGHG